MHTNCPKKIFSWQIYIINTYAFRLESHSLDTIITFLIFPGFQCHTSTLFQQLNLHFFPSYSFSYSITTRRLASTMHKNNVCTMLHTVKLILLMTMHFIHSLVKKTLINDYAAWLALSVITYRHFVAEQKHCIFTLIMEYFLERPGTKKKQRNWLRNKLKQPMLFCPTEHSLVFLLTIQRRS